MSQTSSSDSKIIIFLCRNCGEPTAMDFARLAALPNQEIWVPNLCPACGNYPAEDIEEFTG